LRSKLRELADFRLAVPDAPLLGSGYETSNGIGASEGNDAAIYQLLSNTRPQKQRLGGRDVSDHLEVIKRVRQKVNCCGVAYKLTSPGLRHDHRDRVEKDRWRAGELQMRREQLSIGGLSATDMWRDDF
jgi:hypothetical protein